MLARSLFALSCVFCVCMASGAAAAASEGEGAYANTAPSYDSNFTRSTKDGPTPGNTPEDDARPGVFYFGIGANAFGHKDYRFAVDMYQVAASWAYKPAEYNLGVMYARGQGIPVDLPRAMAWLALAAERNDQQYVDAREIVYAQLSKDQFEQANAIWRDLKKTYGDEVALRRAKARWAEVRNNVTGSHVGFVGNLTVSTPTPHMNPRDVSTGGKGPSSETTAADVVGASAISGAVAYRQLRESDNPYDPKFERQPIGTATVEPLVPVKAGKPDDAATTKSDNVQHQR